MQRINLAVILVTFLQKYRIFYLRSMVTGSTHATYCATQPIYATVTHNYTQNPMPMITLTKIPWVNLKFPLFSLSFPELKNSLSFAGSPGFPEL